MSDSGGNVSEEVDLIVVKEYHLAEEICKALKHGGIHHVEFWPEDILDPSTALVVRGFMGRPVFKPDAKEPQGPFHIRVRQEDLDQAQVVLTASGLVPT
jgi:hypothetical protein